MNRFKKVASDLKSEPEKVENEEPEVESEEQTDNPVDMTGFLNLNDKSDIDAGSAYSKVKKKKKRRSSRSAMATDDDGADNGSMRSGRSIKSSRSSKSSKSSRAQRKIQKKTAQDDDGSMRSGSSIKSSKRSKAKREKKKKPEADNQFVDGEEPAADRVATLKDQIKEQIRENDILTEELELAKAAKASHQDSSRVGDDLARIAELESRLNHANGEKRKLDEAYETLEQEHLQLQISTGINKQSNSAELQRELDLVIEEKTKLEDTLYSQDERMMKLEDVVENLLDKIEFLEDKLEQTEDEMFQMEEELKKLEGESKREDYMENVKAARLTRKRSLKIERQSSKRLLQHDDDDTVSNFKQNKGLPMKAISEDVDELKHNLEETKKGIAELESKCKALECEKKEILETQKKHGKQQEEDLRLIQEDIDDKFSKLEKHNGDLRNKLEKAQKKAQKAHDLEKAVKKLKEKVKRAKVNDVEDEREETPPSPKEETKHGEVLAREQKIIDLEEKVEGYKRASEMTGTDEHVERLKQEIQAYKDGHRNLKKKVKRDQQEALEKSRKKDETIEFLQTEMIKMRKDVEFRMRKKSSVRRSARIPMTEQAQEQMQDLEEEISHWKGQNIDLEKQVITLTTTVSEWKAKAIAGGYKHSNQNNNDFDDLSGDDDESIFSFRSRLSGISKPFGQFDDDKSTVSSISRGLFFIPDTPGGRNDNGDGDQTPPSARAIRGIGTLWNKMRQPLQNQTTNSAIPYTSTLEND